MMCGCAGHDVQTSSVSVADSAGLRTITIGSIDAFGPASRVRLVYRTRPNGVSLYGVRDAVFMNDGSLLLANSGRSELVLLDPSGSEVRRIGRSGDGPGEFRATSWLQADSGGVWVYDAPGRRISRLDQALSFDSAYRLSGIDLSRPLKVITLDGGVFVTTYRSDGRMAGGGEGRDTVPILRVGLEQQSVDTLGNWAGEERAWARVPAGNLVVPVLFGRGLETAGRGAIIVVARTDSIRVVQMDPLGAARWIATVQGEVRIPTTSEIAARRSQVLEHIPLDTKEAVAAWSTAPVRTTLPPLGAIEIDDGGFTWVGLGTGPSDKNRSWLVLDQSGLPVGRVDLPTETWGWARSTEVLDIAGGRVALLFHSDLDEEYVEVWDVSEVPRVPRSPMK